MAKITPFLWFDSQAEEAARFYTSVFKRSKILGVTRYGAAAAEASGRPKGSVMTVRFRLDGQEFVALNGGPVFRFTEAVSFVVNCDTQREVDGFWKKLSKGGEPNVCGWLKDRYGMSWQIVPRSVFKMLESKDKEKARRVHEAVLKMTKLDIKTLKRAYEGGSKRG